MKVKRSAGYIIFEFEEPDFKRDWMGFLRELKGKVPMGARSYDPKTKIWHIEESYADDFYELKKIFFQDKNQTKLDLQA